jgi:hypothetical protein
VTPPVLVTVTFTIGIGQYGGGVDGKFAVPGETCRLAMTATVVGGGAGGTYRAVVGGAVGGVVVATVTAVVATGAAGRAAARAVEGGARVVVGCGRAVVVCVTGTDGPAAYGPAVDDATTRAVP